MDGWGTLFLGLIAIGSIVQCAFVVVATIAIRKTARDLAELQNRFDKDFKPALEDLREGARNLRAVSQQAKESSSRLHGFFSSGLDSVEDTMTTMRSSLLRPLQGLQDISAFIAGVKKGIDAFRATAPSDRKEAKRGTPSARIRRSEDSGEEHMFIG